jgi:hypothetical protein
MYVHILPCDKHTTFWTICFMWPTYQYTFCAEWDSLSLLLSGELPVTIRTIFCHSVSSRKNSSSSLLFVSLKPFHSLYSLLSCGRHSSEGRNADFIIWNEEDIFNPLDYWFYLALTHIYEPKFILLSRILLKLGLKFWSVIYWWPSVLSSIAYYLNKAEPHKI